MMAYRIVLIACALFFSCCSIIAQENYSRLKTRAERFVKFQEWGSANAMYMLMINKQPNEPKNYSRAIVTSGLLSDDKTQVRLLEMTQGKGIPLDSIFTEVYSFAYEIGQSQEYEEFLKLVKTCQPWVARNINIRLLNYYNFRNDAPHIVLMGKELLAATPDDLRFLLAVGRGYMIQGDYENAIVEYKKVLSLDEDNYDALLALGNYYYVMWKDAEGTRSQFTSTRDFAVNYFEQAYALNPTPFVASVLDELRAEN